MPPTPWVLLHRQVRFIEGGSAGGAAMAAAAIGTSRGVASLEEQAFDLKSVPVVAVAEPPEVSFLSIVRLLPEDPMQEVTSGTVSSTDKGLVVLYDGMYQPGNGGGTRTGGYLIYDSWSGSFSAIPQLEPPTGVPSLPNIKCLGASAAVIRCSGIHIVAELVTSFDPGLPDAQLYTWRSLSAPSVTGETLTGGLPSVRQWLPLRQWVSTEVRLPLPAELCGPTCFFHIDLAFAFEGFLCWADLLTGVLICDLFASEGPKFTFIPLPQGCCSSTPKEVRLATKAEEFRSMGVVCGAIKFLDLVGYGQGVSKDQVVLKTWTLSPSFKEWEEGPDVLVSDLWESKSFRDKKLPRGRLMNPVLSMYEDGIIYISLCDIKYVKTHDFLGQCTGMQTVLNGHYVLRLDLKHSKVLYSKRSSTNSLSLLRPIVLASDFSMYLHDHSKIRQRWEEASKVEGEEASMEGEEASEVGGEEARWELRRSGPSTE